MYLFVYLQNLEDFTWPDKILEMDSVTTVYQWYWSQCGEREIEKCPVSYNKMFQSHLELETAELSSVASDLLWRMQVRSDIWSGRINLHCDGGESAFATERTGDLSNNDLSSVSGGLVVRAVMRLELVNLEQCHLSLCQMLTVFNSIIESEDLQLRELHITGNDPLQPDIYNCELVDVNCQLSESLNHHYRTVYELNYSMIMVILIPDPWDWWHTKPENSLVVYQKFRGSLNLNVTIN